MEADLRRQAGHFSALLGVTFLAAATTGANPAYAGPSEPELRAARELFVAAEQDEDAGRWSDALEKLRRVANVRLTSGVRYHVALCEEHLGHLIAALDGFNAARVQAATDGARDVLRLVGAQLDELGPRVPRLTVHVLPADVSATVKLDGTVLPTASLGAPVPIDPGPHTLEASAAQRTPATATIDLRERDVTSIDLTLGDADAAPSAPANVAPPADGVTPPLPASQVPVAEPSHTEAILATGGAIALAGWGVAAFVLAGNAVASGTEQCALQHSPCDGQKNTVRAWDFTAAGSWIAAAAVGTVAVFLWMPPRRIAAGTAVIVGPAWSGVWGSF